jgi:hypothetical protein
MLSMVKESSQNTLERVFPQLQKENLNMSRQAFSAARQKIKREAFEELFQASVAGSYQEGWERWRGYRVMATGGSFIRLPSDGGLVQCLGGLGRECTSATALASLLYDLENNIAAGAKIAPASESGLGKAGLHVRVIQIPLATGEREILITNLSKARMEYEAFGELYRKRWGKDGG